MDKSQKAHQENVIFVTRKCVFTYVIIFFFCSFDNRIALKNFTSIFEILDLILFLYFDQKLPDAPLQIL